MNTFIDWTLSNKVELSGTIFGLIYVWFSIRQSLYTWPAGIITSLLYCWIFFTAKFYAGMGLQGYYVAISIYGWWSWSHGGQTGSAVEKLHVSYTDTSLWIRLFVLNLLLTLLMYYLLGRYTDSPIPFGDALTTSLSVIATWMLARKKIEHWLIWIFIDMVSAGLYLYRGLYPTVFLFMVYSVMAGIGFYEWRKEPVKVSC
ncbi:MAG: nicotinamide riboside transporter PnuC [Bacteroidia bacterium]|nr:nicotinamide riboside transporter PnuC [Bacteroidia bacterium]